MQLSHCSYQVAWLPARAQRAHLSRRHNKREEAQPLRGPPLLTVEHRLTARPLKINQQMTPKLTLKHQQVLLTAQARHPMHQLELVAQTASLTQALRQDQLELLGPKTAVRLNSLQQLMQVSSKDQL